MSDEAYDVALGVLRGFTMGEEVGSQALSVIESQNQALQEENERLGKMLVELNDAQVVQEKALLAIRDSKHAVPPVDASECRAIARNALSPTKETDPE